MYLDMVWAQCSSLIATLTSGKEGIVMLSQTQKNFGAKLAVSIYYDARYYFRVNS